MATDRACYVDYEYESPDASWGVVVRGPMRAVTVEDERFDGTEIDRRHPEIPVFDEESRTTKSGSTTYGRVDHGPKTVEA